MSSPTENARLGARKGPAGSHEPTGPGWGFAGLFLERVVAE